MLSNSLIIILILVVIGIYLYQSNLRSGIVIICSFIYFIFIINGCMDNNITQTGGNSLSTIYTELPDF
jgi:hypothetical protein